MPKNMICWLILFLTFCPIRLKAEEKQDSHSIIISELLFPETVKWKKLADYPHADQSWLDKYKWKLRELYLKNKDYDNMESPECSYITRALYESTGTSNFFYFDLNGDGDVEVVYSGSAECREGDITIIWFGFGKSRDKEKTIVIPFKVLKVLSGQTPQLSSYKYGCCGDPVDQYFIGPIDIPAKQILGVPRDLDLKKEALVFSRNFVVKKELVLRSEPKIDDDYDEGSSQLLNHAMFGNILRKYLAGVDCQQLLKYIDSGGKEWSLVVVPPSADSRSHYTPMIVNIGWTQL